MPAPTAVVTELLSMLVMLMRMQTSVLSSIPGEGVTYEQPDQTSFLSNLGFQAMQAIGTLASVWAIGLGAFAEGLGLPVDHIVSLLES